MVHDYRRATAVQPSARWRSAVAHWGATYLRRVAFTISTTFAILVLVIGNGLLRRGWPQVTEWVQSYLRALTP
jgi:hypothetical protein